MKVTIKDIADRAGISYSSVSRALNGLKGVSDETRARVKQIAEELEYTPNDVARGLVQQQTGTIGFIIPDITNPFYPELARGVEEKASEQGYSVFLCNTNYDKKKEESYIVKLLEKRVDGIILAPISSRNNLLERRNSMPIPCVYVGNAPEQTEYSYVIIDNERGGYLAARTLIEKGYRNIGFISGTENDYVIDERFIGYKSALNRYGIPIDEKFVIFKSWRKNSGYETVCELIASGNYPEAIIAGNDALAMGILQGIKENSLSVPEDIAVIGFDDIPNASWPEINLTSIRQPKIKMGEVAVELILDLLNEEATDVDKTPHKVILDPELIMRGSC